MYTQQINIRVPQGLYDRLRKLTDKDKNWAAPTMSTVINRGIELALGEYGNADADTTDATKRKQRVRK